MVSLNKMYIIKLWEENQKDKHKNEAWDGCNSTNGKITSPKEEKRTECLYPQLFW